MSLRLQDQDCPLDKWASVPPEPPSIPPKEESNWDAVPTPNFLDICPAHHILKRLEKKEFVNLWHFTAQGCQEATTLGLTAPENTFTFISTEKGPMLQPAGAALISSSKVTGDEALSYDQWSEGKNWLLNCMTEHGWSAKEVNQLAKFFLNLDFHPIQSKSFGLQAVL